MLCQHIHIGGDDRFKVRPTPILALGRLEMDDARDEDFLRRLRPHGIGAGRDEPRGQLARVLLDAAIRGHIPH